MRIKTRIHVGVKKIHLFVVNKNPHKGILILVACTDCKFPYSLSLYGPLSPALLLRREPVGSSSDTDQNKNPQKGILILVALVGLEPTLLAELDFESSASTNSATGPWHQKANYLCSFLCVNFFYQTCTAVCLVNRFFCRCSRFASLFFNGFFNCSHFSC